MDVPAIIGSVIGGGIVGFFAFRTGYRKGVEHMRKIAEGDMRAVLEGIVTAAKVDSPTLAPGSVINPVLAPGSVNSPRLARGAATFAPISYDAPDDSVKG